MDNKGLQILDKLLIKLAIKPLRNPFYEQNIDLHGQIISRVAKVLVFE